jgi:hypothetical protein
VGGATETERDRGAGLVFFTALVALVRAAAFFGVGFGCDLDCFFLDGGGGGMEALSFSGSGVGRVDVDAARELRPNGAGLEGSEGFESSTRASNESSSDGSRLEEVGMGPR